MTTSRTLFRQAARQQASSDLHERIYASIESEGNRTQQERQADEDMEAATMLAEFLANELA